MSGPVERGLWIAGEEREAESEERLESRDGRMHLSGRPGLGVTLTDQMRAWTVDRVHVDAPR